MVGFSKTGVPGLGVLIVPLMTDVFPADAKLAMGALLPMLLTGDVFAVTYYRKHVHWDRLWALFPFVAAGMVPGLLLLMRIEGDKLKPLLGFVILPLVVLEVLRRKYKWERVPQYWWFTASMGALAGFATAVGNVAGPVMAIYLLSRGLSKKEFVGTGAWFYFIVNLLKIPFYVYDKMITQATLTFNAWALPVILVGVFLGFKALPRVPRKWFDGAILVLAFFAALRLVLSFSLSG
jgi:uncharacterized membrane protein YfcA